MKHSVANKAAAEKIRASARLYIDGLSGRLRALSEINNTARHFAAGEEEQYGKFKDFFLTFLDHTEECMILSTLTEETLALPQKLGMVLWEEHGELEKRYLSLQVFFLDMVVSTLSRLLAIWKQRLGDGYGLGYGSYEVFLLAQRVINEIIKQLHRPRYEDALNQNLAGMAATCKENIEELLAESPRFNEFKDELPQPNQGMTAPFTDEFSSPEDDSFASSHEEAHRRIDE